MSSSVHACTRCGKYREVHESRTIGQTILCQECAYEPPAWPGKAATAWIEHAACAGMDTNMFYRDGRRPHNPDAKRTCRACPVRNECLNYAIENDEREGVWGGLDEDERAQLRRRRQHGRPPRVWTEAQVERLQQLVNEGMSSRQIAHILGTTRDRVNGARSRYQVENPQRSATTTTTPAGKPVQPAVWDPDRIARLVELVNTGHKTSEIAEMLGTTLWSVKSARRRYLTREANA